MRRLFMWFLYTRLGQWLSLRITGGWCYIRQNDPRWLGAGIRSYVYKYPGDSQAAPDKGISEQRKTWTTWECLQMPPDSYGGYLAIHTHKGHLIACLGQYLEPGSFVAFRVGYETGFATFITSTRKSFQPDKMKPTVIGRWENDKPEPPIELADGIESKVYFV